MTYKEWETLVAICRLTGTFEIKNTPGYLRYQEFFLGNGQPIRAIISNDSWYLGDPLRSYPSGSVDGIFHRIKLGERWNDYIEFNAGVHI